MSIKYLDESGLSYFWTKLKNYFQEKLVSGTNIKTVNNNSLLGSGNVSISSGDTLLVQNVLLNDNQSISANSYGNNNGSVTKSGYTPIGVVGMHTENASSNGINNTSCPIHSFYLSNNKVYWIVRNVSSSSAKIKVTASVLYKAN